MSSLSRSVPPLTQMRTRRATLFLPTLADFTIASFSEPMRALVGNNMLKSIPFVVLNVWHCVCARWFINNNQCGLMEPSLSDRNAQLIFFHYLAAFTVVRIADFSCECL